MIRNKSNHLTTFIAASTLILLGSSLHGQVTAPYSNDFSSNISDFTTSGDWTLNTTDDVLEYNSSGTANSIAAVDTTNLGGDANSALDFELTTVFSVNSLSGTVFTGVGLLGNDTGLSGGGSNPYYLLDLKDDGGMRILELNTSNTTLATGTFAGGALAASDTFTLTASGSYAGGELTITFTIDDGTDSTTIAGVDATPLTGTVFGLRNRATSGNSLSLDYSSFNLAVIPEPSTYAVLMGGLFALLATLRSRLRR